MMNRFSLLLASAICVTHTLPLFAADPELEKLNPSDRAVIQKLLAIDPKSTWMSGPPERVSYVGFGPVGATTTAIGLLPQLPELSTVDLLNDYYRRISDWKPGDLGPLSRCLKLHELRVVIGEDQTAETWKSLPVLGRIKKFHVFDQAAGRVEITDRFPEATAAIFWTDRQQEFNVQQFNQLGQLTKLDLHLEKSTWSGKGLSHLNHCQNLEALTIGGQGLTDIALEQIGEIKTVKNLTLLAGNYTPAGFEALSNLESFRCPESWFNDDLATGLKNCRNLKQMNLWGANVNGSCFKVLAKLPLEDVVCIVALENLKWFKDCKTLKQLEVGTSSKLLRDQQQSIWSAIGQNAQLKQRWTGDKSSNPKSGK